MDTQNQTLEQVFGDALNEAINKILDERGPANREMMEFLGARGCVLFPFEIDWEGLATKLNDEDFALAMQKIEAATYELASKQ